MKKRIAAVLCLCMSLLILCLSVMTAASADTDTFETYDENTINNHSYNRYNDPVRTYLRPVDGGCMRVYGNDDGTLLAEYYDSSYRFVSNRIVHFGLTLFGGFYEYGNYYYVLSGQLNRSENPFTEVFRVTKFSKDWNEIGHGSLCGAATTVPFDAGKADFAVYGSMMIIRTCHELYADPTTGVNHQANVTLRVNLTDMSLDGSFTDPLNIKSAGYISHSFNQFVAIDSDGTVVCLDHGDAHPRSAVLGRYRTKGENLVIRKPGVETYEYVSLVDYAGPEDYNITGGMVGGLECSSSSYLTVGAVVEQNSDFWRNRAYNAYISVTDKHNFTAAGTRIIYLTDFRESDGYYASNPQLVKLSNDRFLVMWNEFPTPQEHYYVANVRHDYDENYRMKYVYINGQGEAISDVTTAPAGSMAYVSECEPAVADGRVLWYVSDGESISAIAEIGADGKLTVHDRILPEDTFFYPIDLSLAHVAFRSFDRLSPNVSITEDNFNDYVFVHYRGRELTFGEDYILSTDPDYEPIFIEYRGDYISGVALELYPVEENRRSYLPAYYQYIWSAVYNSSAYITKFARQRDGVHLNCLATRGVGYHVYRMEEDEEAYTQIGSVYGTPSNSSVSSFVDHTAAYDKTYSYRIREFTYDKNGSEILSEPSAEVTVGPAPDDWVIEATQPTEPSQPSESAAPSGPSGSTPPQMKLGDADGDGGVTIVDATVIQRCLASLQKWDDVQAAAADTDEDGKRTILDATTIQRWLAGLDKTHPLGQFMNTASDN